MNSIGWRVVGEKPKEKKCVVIAAPHTTNLDLPIMLACASAMEIRLRWVGKHTLFKGPAGVFMNALGGVPVVRHRRTNFVTQMAALFDAHDEFLLAVATEGTRSYTPSWKSGFYYIAEEAGVPIVPGFLDYKKKECGLGEPIYTTGDIHADMDKIRAFYDGKLGLYPDQMGPIVLRSELESAES